MKRKQDIIKQDKKYILHTYAPFDIVIDRGNGSKVYDTEGNEYLDFLAGIAVCALGHNNKKILRTIVQQSKKIMMCSNYFYSSARIELAKTLLENTHFGKAFFCNSGAEANETAIKIFKKYSNKLGKGKYKIVSCKNSFHGRTIATVKATGQEKYNKPFSPMPEWFIYVPFNDTKALEEVLNDDEVGALMVECIQGEGGIFPATQEFLTVARELTRNNKQLLIIDEVQTGIMRTGKMYCYEHYNIEPDIISLAKGLGGGFPIGACLATDEVSSFIEAGDHGTTFGGNPLACSVANTVVNELKKPFMINHINEISEYLYKKLKTLPKNSSIKEIRGKGLMIGIQFVERIVAKDIVKKLLENGVISSAAGNNTLRLVPPLIIKKEEIDKMVEILANIIKEQ